LEFADAGSMRTTPPHGPLRAWACVHEAAWGRAASEAPAEPATAEPAAEERPRPPKRGDKKSDEPEVIPGAHLEPDLVLDQAAGEGEGDEYAQYAEDVDEDTEAAPEPEAAPVRSPLELAADARYQATGKRKTA